MDYHNRRDKLVFWTCVLLSIGAHSASSDEVPDDELVHYGNAIPQDYFIGDTALKSYVDYTADLGWGYLYKYSVYIGNYTLGVRPIPSVRLQIWIPKAEGFTDPEYQLKWETILTVEEDGLNKLHEIVLPASERIEISSRDRLGLTAEQKSCPVAMDYVTGVGYTTHFKFIENDQFPAVDDKIHIFDRASVPIRFSLGISLITSIPIEEDQQFCGNELKPRANYVEAFAKRVWLDYDVQLVAGVLDEILFFVADIAHQLIWSPQNVSLQIWTPGSGDQFVLKWERFVVLDQGVNKLYKVIIEEEDSIEIDEVDKLAWAYTGDIGHITYDFVPTHKTYTCTKCMQNGLPAVGANFTFDTVGQPNQFSIGAFIRPGAKLKTGGTSTVTVHAGCFSFLLVLSLLLNIGSAFRWFI